MDSHQRRMFRREIQRMVLAQSEKLQNPPVETIAVTCEDPTPAERAFLFFENSVILAVMSLIGSFVGIFVDGRYFLILCLPIAFGLHRSSALKGTRVRTKVLVYPIVVGVSAYLLWIVGTGVNRSRSHIPTPAEIAQQVWNGHSPFSTVVNQNYTIAASPEPKAKLDIGFDTGDGQTISNTITVPDQLVAFGIRRHLGKERNLPFLPSNVVRFTLLAKASSELGAKNIHAWVRICNDCDFASAPEGFLPSNGPLGIIDINGPVDDTPANAVSRIGEFAVALPVGGVTSTPIKVAYTCDNCKVIKVVEPKTLTVNVAKITHQNP